MSPLTLLTSVKSRTAIHTSQVTGVSTVDFRPTTRSRPSKYQSSPRPVNVDEFVSFPFLFLRLKSRKSRSESREVISKAARSNFKRLGNLCAAPWPDGRRVRFFNLCRARALICRIRSGQHRGSLLFFSPSRAYCRPYPGRIIIIRSLHRFPIIEISRLCLFTAIVSRVKIESWEAFSHNHVNFSPKSWRMHHG